MCSGHFLNQFSNAARSSFHPLLAINRPFPYQVMSTEKAMEGCKGQIIVVPRTGELFHHKRKSNLPSLLSCDVSIKTDFYT